MIWRDVMPRMNLALKITNWCNLCCAHCCERSHAKEQLNLMPVGQIEKYIEQYKNMGIPVWDYITFTGGESMAPYFFNRGDYIPTVSKICINNGFVPAFKTNAKWNLGLTNRILKDIADVVHKNDCQISLDISVDEYHDNLYDVANVIKQVMNSQYLSAAIPVTLVGLNTVASQYKYNELVTMLRKQGIHVGPMESDGSFLVSYNDNLNVMFYDVGGLTRLGRAADNNLTLHTVMGKSNSGGSDCLMITNDNKAILNYKYKTVVDNKTVGQIYNELIQNKR
ncbi:MAG: radical SAM protein [Alphaproteobacteria bacterium]|nr:radical SAM protein [Alphaproteobacteria bacterium]